jgi:cytochrome c-type biogenesis protein CcmH
MPTRRPSWRHIVLALVCWGTLVVAHPAHAVQPDEVLADANLEARARALSRELRCMVCQNQSIDDSDAPLARDLRVLVRERITKGDSDDQVIGFLVSRYGEFVLLKPPFEWHTAILWLTPLFAVLVGAITMFAAIRRRRAGTSPPLPLDADEERRLREVLDKSG